MLTPVKFITPFVLLLCISAETVFEKKCSKFSEVEASQLTHYPHLVQIIAVSESRVHKTCIATLITEKHAITTATCISNSNETFFVKKLYVIGDLFLHFDIYRVAQVILHPEYKQNVPLYDIGLIELDENLPILRNESMFKPACVYTDLDIEEVDNTILYQDKTGIRTFDIKPITGNECQTRLIQNNSSMSDSILCFKYKLRNKFHVIHGVPIQVKAINSFYITAIKSDFTKRYEGKWMMSPFIKTSSISDWIEETIWNVQKKNFSSEKLQVICGIRKMNHVPLIYNGMEAIPGEFPWHVPVYYRTEYICGGTIISKRIVVTAAHCLSSELGNKNYDDLLIYTGITNLIEDLQNSDSYKIQSYTINAFYNRERVDNDIALLHTKDDILFKIDVQPICIQKNEIIISNQSGIVAGWGRTEQNTMSKILTKVTSPIIDNMECRSTMRSFFKVFLQLNKFCAGILNQSNACKGDSGGGLIIPHDGIWYLAGIVSMGIYEEDDLCNAENYVIYTDVSKYYDWIISKI